MYVCRLAAAVQGHPSLSCGVVEQPANTSLLDMIDKSTLEIRQDEDKVVYKSLEEIGDDLPDHAPRFVLLSYPLTLVSRFSS